MLELRGQPLTLEQIVAVANGQEQVTLADEARARAEASRRSSKGSCSRIAPSTESTQASANCLTCASSLVNLRELQLNLVRSHSCGLGNPLSKAESRAMLLLRANVLACGFSGARPVIVETLVAMLAARSDSGHSRKRFGRSQRRSGAVGPSRVGGDR